VFAIPTASVRLRAARPNWKLIAGLAIILGMLTVAVLAPYIAPGSPYDQSLSDRLLPPSFVTGGVPEHILGTDHLGRDYASRMIYGTRIALMIGIGTAALSGIFGVALGLIAGYFGGRIDTAVMYLVTVRLSLPLILVALAVVGLVGSALPTIMAVLAALLWDRFAVVTRTLAQRLRDREFVLLARATGCSDLHIMVREILPNLAGPLLVVTTLEMAHAILLESALSFLGLGVRPPEASWGLMIAEAKDYIYFDPWLVNLPGMALFVMVVGLNLIGDGLQRRDRR
jgi:peptide/nickel transport system permease protein